MPLTKVNHDAIWVVVVSLTKSAHFIPVKMNMNMLQLLHLYIESIVKLHGTPASILLDRDPKFSFKRLKGISRCHGHEVKV